MEGREGGVKKGKRGQKRKRGQRRKGVGGAKYNESGGYAVML